MCEERWQRAKCEVDVIAKRNEFVAMLAETMFQRLSTEDRNVAVARANVPPVQTIIVEIARLRECCKKDKSERQPWI